MTFAKLVSAEPGSVSNGTLCSRDLLKAFADELNGLVLDEDNEWNGAYEARGHMLDIVHEAYALLVHSDDALLTTQAENVSEVVDAMVDHLDTFSPDGHHFGSHEGDSALFGFWPNEDYFDECDDGDTDVEFVNETTYYGDND